MGRGKRSKASARAGVRYRSTELMRFVNPTKNHLCQGNDRMQRLLKFFLDVGTAVSLGGAGTGAGGSLAARQQSRWNMGSGF